MPIWVYIYCSLLTLSTIYGIRILKPKPTYMLAAALFVTFCWLVCIDFFVANSWIFRSKITFAIYFICAIFWQAIEYKTVMIYMRTKNAKSMDALAAMKDEFGQSQGLTNVIIGIFSGIIFIFYLPILIMSIGVFLEIPSQKSEETSNLKVSITHREPPQFGEPGS